MRAISDKYLKLVFIEGFHVVDDGGSAPSARSVRSGLTPPPSMSPHASRVLSPKVSPGVSPRVSPKVYAGAVDVVAVLHDPTHDLRSGMRMNQFPH